MPPSARKSADADAASARWKIGNESKAMLEQEFLRKRFPSPRSKKRLADELNVEPRRIQVWFQNRRQREKLPEDELQDQSAGSELQQSLERYPTFGRESFGGAAGGAFGAASGAWTLDAASLDRSAHHLHSYAEAELPSHNPPRAKLPKLDKSRSGGQGGGTRNVGRARERDGQQHPPALPTIAGRPLGVPGTLTAGLLSATGPSLLSSSDDIVHALMDFDQGGGLKRRGSGAGGLGGSIFDSSGSLYELEERLLAGESGAAAAAAALGGGDVQSVGHSALGLGGQEAAGGSGGSLGGSSRAGSSLFGSGSKDGSDATAALSNRAFNMSPADLMDCGGSVTMTGLASAAAANAAGTSAAKLPPPPCLPLPRSEMEGSAEAGAAGAIALPNAWLPTPATRQGSNGGGAPGAHIPPVSREYQGAANMLEAAASAARAGGGDSALLQVQQMQALLHSGVWGGDEYSAPQYNDVADAPHPLSEGGGFGCTASSASSTAAAPASAAPESDASSAAAAAASASAPLWAQSAAAAGLVAEGALGAPQGGSRGHMPPDAYLCPNIPAETLKAIAFASADDCGGGAMGSCSAAQGTMQGVVSCNVSEGSLPAPPLPAQGGLVSGGWSESQGRTSMGGVQREMTSWIHAADTVNAVLSTARQHYSLAVGRPLANVASAEVAVHLHVPNPLHGGQRAATHAAHPALAGAAAAPPGRPHAAQRSLSAGAPSLGGAHYDALGGQGGQGLSGQGAQGLGAQGGQGAVGGPLPCRSGLSASSLAPAGFSGGGAGLGALAQHGGGFTFGSGVQMGAQSTAGLKASDAAMQQGRLGGRPAGLPASALDASDAFGTRLGAAMPFQPAPAHRQQQLTTAANMPMAQAAVSASVEGLEQQQYATGTQLYDRRSPSHRSHSSHPQRLSVEVAEGLAAAAAAHAAANAGPSTRFLAPDAVMPAPAPAGAPAAAAPPATRQE